MKHIARNLSIALLTTLAFSLTAFAQNSSGLVTATDALGISCGGWSAGNLTTESYDLLDYGATKSNRVFAQGVELTAPGCGLSVFGGGVLWQPDTAALLNKTNLPSGNFLTFLDASVGNGIPATGADRLTTILGGGVKYIASDNVTWNTIRFEEVFFGSSRYPSISSGLSVYFGGVPASAATSSNVKRALLKRIAASTARLTAK